MPELTLKVKGKAVRPDGTLRDESGRKLEIDGLWALEFGNGGSNGDAQSLFFTAGPDEESHGLFGKITAS